MEGAWFPYACIFIVATLISLFLTPFVNKLAWRCGAVDYPSKRRINTKPIPRMGGIAIFVALVAAYGIQWFGTTYLDWSIALVPYPGMKIDYHRIALAFVVIFAVGIADDLHQLRPLVKLFGQIFAAVIAVSGGLIIGNIANPLGPNNIDLGWLAYPITILYLVAYVNIINLIDGLDGLATGISAISSFTMFFLAFMAGRLDAAFLAIALCGANLGFLAYNFNPATIFLGDAGSLLLGFALGTISLLNVTRFAGLTTIVLPMLIAGIPIIDTFSAIIRRKRAHVSVGQADKGHIHHRLIRRGFDQRQAVTLIYIWTALLCLGALLMTQVETRTRVVVFLLLVAVSGGFAVRLHLFEPILRHHYGKEETDKDRRSPRHGRTTRFSSPRQSRTTRLSSPRQSRAATTQSPPRQGRATTLSKERNKQNNGA